MISLVTVQQRAGLHTFINNLALHSSQSQANIHTHKLTRHVLVPNLNVGARVLVGKSVPNSRCSIEDTFDIVAPFSKAAGSGMSAGISLPEPWLPGSGRRLTIEKAGARVSCSIHGPHQ